MADAWDDITPAEHLPWESMAPGPALAQVIASVDPLTLAPSARVSYLRATDRLMGWAHVQQARALVSVSDAVREATSPMPGASTSYQPSYVADEIAAALHVAPSTATGKVNAATAILRDWPRLGHEVACGRLTVAQAREIYEGVCVLAGVKDEEGLDLSERAVVGLIRIAGSLPPARLRERVARVVATLDPEAAARRRTRASRELTDVTIWAEADGIACLAARGSSIDAIALHDTIAARATSLREGAAADDERTIGQWRFAALLAAFGMSPAGMPVAGQDVAPSTAPPSPSGALQPVHPQVRVIVPVDTLLGLADLPGEIEGYGPIDPEFARTLAADADWIRWVTDGVEDVLIDEGRRRYPGARLARFLRARDRRCKHPACGVRSSRCDADHLPVAYAEGGRTSAETMAPTCPRHNRQRAASGWQVADEVPRDPMSHPTPVWTSPLGRQYQSPPPRPLVHDYIPRRT